ncbi:MAG: exo-beta-N-acetylmuramidase NamZ family protein [Desulfuromonadaceae bacterium]
MRNLIITLFLLSSIFSPGHASAHKVLPGIDVIAGQQFSILHGKRVGLITNHTGRNASGVSTIDLLFHAPGVRLVALFSPEHGIRGDADEKLDSSVDSVTGLPVHSLYGKSCRPTPAMLEGVDLLVFDIQDIGTRFYTYIGTLSLVMQAAKVAGIPLVVLDRPNPIGGGAVQGAVPAVTKAVTITVDNGCRLLTSIHPIPTRHGMTMGELARLFNTEYGIGCDLTVIPMKGWRRSMYFDDTGLAWVNPSPNMKSQTTALLYPGFGVLEAANLSVGRGTALPFKMYGAPWVDSAAVMRNLSARTTPGVTFEPCMFVPTAAGHPYIGKTCFGICLSSIDRTRLDPFLAGLHLLQAFYEAHPKEFTSAGGFAVMVGDDDVWEMLTQQKKTPEFTVHRWKDDLERFEKVRETYLLY